MQLESAIPLTKGAGFVDIANLLPQDNVTAAEIKGDQIAFLVVKIQHSLTTHTASRISSRECSLEV